MSFSSSWSAGRVTRFAGHGGRFVEKHRVSADDLLERMTRGTCDVFVPSLKRKSCLVVVEKGRLPLDRIVATCAVGSTRTELVGMRVLVAIAAIDGSFREVHMLQIQLQIWRFVAVRTCNRAVCAHQRIPRLLMVELR